MFAGLAAGAAGVFLAVASALGAPTTTSGVAAAHATTLQAVTHTVRIGATRVKVTTKPSGSVCYSAPGVSGCASSLADGQLSYATGHAGKRVVLAGVTGAGVKGVIARLSHKGTVWPAFHGGAFYAVLPLGHRLTGIVKVLAGGRRISFTA
ncbi:MAG TPA: hypothetical protein VGU02_10635 [Gaiellaceae bacterium]|nr:hypothetical protein [Gaiellaceae bacterium]